MSALFPSHEIFNLESRVRHISGFSEASPLGIQDIASFTSVQPYNKAVVLSAGGRQAMMFFRFRKNKDSTVKLIRIPILVLPLRKNLGIL